MDQTTRQEIEAIEAIVRQCIAECVRVGFGSSRPVIRNLEALKRLHADPRPTCNSCGKKLILCSDRFFRCPSCWIGC